jgi:hypothetical protein
MSTAWPANLIYQEEYCFLECRVVWYVVTRVSGEPAAFNFSYTLTIPQHPVWISTVDVLRLSKGVCPRVTKGTRFSCLKTEPIGTANLKVYWTSPCWQVSMDGMITDRGTFCVWRKTFLSTNFSPTNLTFFGACFLYVVKLSSNIPADHLVACLWS